MSKKSYSKARNFLITLHADWVEHATLNDVRDYFKEKLTDNALRYVYGQVLFMGYEFICEHSPVGLRRPDEAFLSTA